MTVLPIKVIAQPHYEYDKESIKITGEVYENYEYERVAERLKDSVKKPQARRGFNALPRVSGKTLCSCVETAKILTNKEFGSIGYARNLKPNSNIPKVGSIVILDENAPDTNSGHLAAVITVWKNTFVVAEGNYKSCSYTERELPKDYDKLIGFYE